MMNWRSPISFLVAFTALCAVTTLFLRVPLPSKGYFNFGDVAVVFSGLMFGRYIDGKARWAGGVPGAIGSALADILGGYAFFAPVTLVAKLIEGSCGILASRGGWRWSFLVLGGIALVGIYFLGEVLLPQVGLAGAIAEVVPNMVQAVGGALGGLVLFRAFSLIVDSGDLN
jgi:uncharacterized membrane protein